MTDEPPLPDEARVQALAKDNKRIKQLRKQLSSISWFMAELTMQPENTATHPLADTSRTGRRASDMGILPMSLDSYRRLLDGTARLIQSGERSTIPKDLAAVLDHMNIEQEAWLDTVRGYDELFCHVVGSCASMGKAASGRVFK